MRRLLAVLAAGALVAVGAYLAAGRSSRDHARAFRSAAPSRVTAAASPAAPPPSLPSSDAPPPATGPLASPADTAAFAAGQGKLSIAGAPERVGVAGLSPEEAEKYAAMIAAHEQANQAMNAQERERQRAEHRRWREIKRTNPHLRRAEVQAMTRR